MDIPRKKKIIIFITISITVIAGIVLGFFIINLISKTSFNSAVKKIRLAVLDAYPGRCSISVQDTTLRVNIWSDNIGAISKKAAEGDKECIQYWNEIKDKMQSTAISLQNHFLLVKDATFYFSYVNEQNPDRYLLTFKNAQLMYDVVTGYNKGG